MSGFEIVGVVFGVLPILIEAVKGYSIVSKKFHTFRHYSRDVRKIHVQFEVHTGIFHNECRLLLQSVVHDDLTVKDMLDDTSNTQWQSKELDERLRGCLEDSVSLCFSIIEASNVILQDLKKELDKFDVLMEKKTKDEPLKRAILRLRDSVKISFNESKYQGCLKSLRDRNADLSQLRAHLNAFRQQRVCHGESCIGRRTLPKRIGEVQKASKKLHEAIPNAWCCSNHTHAGHFAKICLDADVQTGVRLDLAISCPDRRREDDRPWLAPGSPIWLYVHSVSIATTERKRTLPEDQTREELSPTLISIDAQSRSTVLESSCSGGKIKRKKVGNFPEPINPEAEFQHPTVEQVRTAITKAISLSVKQEINIFKTQNICRSLRENLLRCRDVSEKRRVGYLETPNMFKHEFFLEEKRNVTSHIPTKEPTSYTYSISNLMEQSLETDLTVLDQLKLAHKLAVAILQFNETPWLSETWRLEDLCYFGTHDRFDESSLKTLHLSAQISASSISESAPMDGVERESSSTYVFSEEEYFGINNAMLFRLGVAFLELGHWKPLEKLSKEQDPNPILTARCLASRSTSLGPKYQNIVHKLLQCNFGFGTDLSKQELQAAVYGDVVCELETMIKCLSI